ncbi:prepilin-type N-terminal cleavage/methylation domain-containing protein [Lachnospiraceae bacterium NE2001]|nr:prepilin-type N-terminal cleavage/methylation domain-containing protein [Lachnospiraceae bacterium NE2001]
MGERGNNGFSLVELLIVISIMTILAAAVAPALIRYLDKSRKAVDIETAQMMFEAAELASTSGNDDAYTGWAIPVKTTKTADVSRTWVGANGHNCNLDGSISNRTEGSYEIVCIAWCRGVYYKSPSNKNSKGWENSQFKSTLDDKGGEEAELTREYTDEFLKNLFHLDGVGKVYGGTDGANSFDGYHAGTMLPMKYKKNAGYGDPECWMVCVNCTSMKPEIWIGDKNFNGRGVKQKVRPLYRLYPDPCAEYK